MLPRESYNISILHIANTKTAITYYNYKFHIIILSNGYRSLIFGSFSHYFGFDHPTYI